MRETFMHSLVRLSASGPQKVDVNDLLEVFDGGRSWQAGVIGAVAVFLVIQALGAVTLRPSRRDIAISVYSGFSLICLTLAVLVSVWNWGIPFAVEEVFTIELVNWPGLPPSIASIWWTTFALYFLTIIVLTTLESHDQRRAERNRANRGQTKQHAHL